MTADRTCVQHGDQIVWEPGGVDMPTIRGRWYCPTCQTELMALLGADAEEGRRLASQRDDLIAQGVNPADLEIPIHPGDFR